MRVVCIDDKCKYEEGCPKIKKGNIYTVVDSAIVGGVSPASGRPCAKGVYYKLLETDAWHFYELFVPINEDQQDETELIRERKKQLA